MQYIVLKLLKIKYQKIEYQQLNFTIEILAGSNYILFKLKPLQQSTCEVAKANRLAGLRKLNHES